MNKSAKIWLTRRDAFATTLLAIAYDRYQDELFTWSPGGIYLQLKADFGIQISYDNLDKLMAAIDVITSNEYWVSLPKFIELTNVFAREGFDHQVFDPADVDEIAWAVMEASLLDPEHQPPSPDIAAYIDWKLTEEGFTSAPQSLAGIGLSRMVLDDSTFSDPELLQAVYTAQTDKTSLIDQVVREQILELSGQLQSLPLQSAVTSNMAEAVQAAISQLTAR